MILKFALSIALSAPFASFAASKTFSLPTADRYTFLNGQIDYPAMTANQKVSAVLFVGGTGLFDRDYFFGHSGTDADLLFKDFARRLNEKGMAAVRFDYRGVSCNLKTVLPIVPPATREDYLKTYVQKCIQNLVRGQVNVKNIREDIATVYQYMKADKNIDSKKLIVLGHSEGTVHTSFMVGEKTIQPKGLLFIGFVGESPQAVLNWQTSTRTQEVYWKIDADGDGHLTNEEIDATCGTVAPLKCSVVKSETGFWTRESLAAYFEKTAAVQRAEYNSHADLEPFKYLFGEQGAIFSSYGWWKFWLNENREVYRQLLNFPGKISLNNGDIDAATPSERNFPQVEAARAQFKGEIHINRYPGRGHALGVDPSLGPIPEDSMSQLFAEISWLLQ